VPAATVPDQAAAPGAPGTAAMPVTPGTPGSAPARGLTAPPPDARHIKATAKLHRFDFPGADAVLQNPVARGTVRMPRFDGADSQPVSSQGPAAAPAPASINKTALLPRARIPVGPENATAFASGGGGSSPAQGRPRFELPASSGGAAATGGARANGPAAATGAKPDSRVMIAAGILLGFLAVAAVVTVIAVLISRCSGASSASPNGGASAPVPSSADLSPASTAVSAPKASAAAALDGELEVVCTPACERIYVDTKAMPASPQPMRLSPGKHSVVVTKTGSASQTKQVTLRGGEKSTLTFTLTPSR
jgi:hypothetical protein